MAEFLSPEYAEQLRIMLKGGWGHTAHRVYKEVLSAINKFEGVESVLDYGCGNQSLKPYLKDFEYVPYDPPIDPNDPKPCDFVVCVDVLEHIEPEYLNRVLTHIKKKKV